MLVRTGSEDTLRHAYSDKRHSNFIHKDTTWTIGTTGGAAFDSISSAFNYIKLNNVIVSPGKTLTLKINNGYIAKEQVLIENMNLSGVVLKSDSLISVDLRGLTIKTLGVDKYFMYVTKSSGLTIKAKFDFTLSKATVADIYGVVINNSSAIRIENSTFSNFSKTGVVASSNTTLELSSCTFTQNTGNGISVANGASAVITECTINSNTANGIIMSGGASANIYNCTANLNTIDGIHVSGGASVNIHKGTFNSNVDGIYVAYGASANIYNCTSNSNTGSGIYVTNGASANCTSVNGQRTIGTNSTADFVCNNAALLTLSACTGGQSLTPGTATAAGLILRVD